MANPQPDKFVRISNELFDAMARFPLAGNERRCLDAVIRHTYGGKAPGGGQTKSRKTCIMSYGEIARYLRMGRSSVQMAMKNLVEMKVISQWETAQQSYSWQIQKDYDRWKRVYKGTVQKCTTPQYTTVQGARVKCTRSNTPLTVQGDSTGEGLTTSNNTTSEHPLTVHSGGTPRLKTKERQRQKTQQQTLTTPKPAPDPSADSAALPRSYSELSQDWKDRLEPLCYKFEKVPGFKAFAWVGLALSGKCSKRGRCYSPETIYRVLSGVDPEGNVKSIYAVLQTFLNHTQEIVEHEEHKKHESTTRRGATSIGKILGQ